LGKRHCLHGLLPLRGLTVVLDLGSTLSSYPAVLLNCIKDPLYHDACISISDRLLIQVCSWLVFEECPFGTGSLLAHIFHSLLIIFIVHTQLKMPLLYYVSLFQAI